MREQDNMLQILSEVHMLIQLHMLIIELPSVFRYILTVLHDLTCKLSKSFKLYKP